MKISVSWSALFAAAALTTKLVACDQSDPTRHEAPRPQLEREASPNPIVSTSAAPSARSVPDASMAADAGKTAAADASAEAHDPTHRDKDLRACCGFFDPYATGFVANKGPNMGSTERLCLGLWKKGYTLAEVEPQIRKSVIKKRYFMPKLCQAEYVEARRAKRNATGH